MEIATAPETAPETASPGLEGRLRLPRGGTPVAWGRVSVPGLVARQPAARRFALLFLAVAAVWLSLVAVFNWLVNPWGLYAPRLFTPRVVDDRHRKCGLLRHCQPPPEQLVLGSSRTMRFEPRRLREKTGLRTFNAGIPGATPVDYLTLYRFAAERLRAPIRSVVLGADIPALFGHERNYPVVRANAELSRYLPTSSSLASDVSGLSLLLNGAQTSDAWASLRHALGLTTRGDRPWRILDPDGFESRSNDDEARERGRWDQARNIREQMEAPLRNRSEMDPTACRDLDLLLGLLQRRGVQTVVFVTPSLEPARERWRRRGLQAVEQEAFRRIRNLALARGARFVDLSRIESFHGDPREFYDAIHPTVANTRKMIDVLFPRPAAGAR
jgi:hypothetical protein